MGLHNILSNVKEALAEGRFITGVSKGGKNRTRMISVTDAIAPATPSVIAGGSKGWKGRKREPMGVSPTVGAVRNVGAE